MILGLFILVSYIIGSIGKCLILDHMKGFKIRDRPINVLIFVNEIIYHLLITFTTFNLLIVLLTFQTPVKFLEDFLSIDVDEEVKKLILSILNNNIFSAHIFSIQKCQ